MNPYFEFHVRK